MVEVTANRGLPPRRKASARSKPSLFRGELFRFTPHVGARVSLVDVDDYSINMDDKALFSVNEDKATIFEVPVGLAVKTPTFMFQTFKV